MRVLDIFCGAGGLSLGFACEHFAVTGVDNNSWAGEVFNQNNIGGFIQKDLKEDNIQTECTILSGGPPCRPWSALNLTRRKDKHPDYSLLERYFQHVLALKPEVFLMENVIHLSYDDFLGQLLNSIHKEEYFTGCRIVCYSDWGAATKRRRLLVIGFKGSPFGPDDFFERLDARKTQPATVGQAILKYERVKRGDLPDHEWPRLRTIHKYKKYYETNKYGWYKLAYDKPAPSFGNIMKTYILHPVAGENSVPLRVISIREAMAIMGFGDSFVFPDGMSMGMRYQMVADSVSPVFSTVCASVLRDMLGET